MLEVFHFFYIQEQYFVEKLLLELERYEKRMFRHHLLFLHIEYFVNLYRN